MELWLGKWTGVYQRDMTTWLRFYTPEGELVLTADEAATRRAATAEENAAAEAVARRAAEENAAAEASARRAAEENAVAEAVARRAAEENAAAEAAARRAAEEEVERLRTELVRLRGPDKV